MKIIDKSQDQINEWLEQITDLLSRLSVRERVMVIVASIIVVVAIVGGAIWKMHSAANLQQKRVNELKDTLVWMQGHVVTMKPATDLALSASDKVQRVAQQQGISVASQQVDGKIQIVAEHENYAILANLLTQMAQMGLSIEKLELNKVGTQIKLTATIL